MRDYLCNCGHMRSDHAVETCSSGGYCRVCDCPVIREAYDEPDTTTMLTTEITLPAGAKLYMEDQVWEFDEPTKIAIVAPDPVV